MLSESSVEQVCHPDSLGYSMNMIDPEELSGIRTKMIRKVIRDKVIYKQRLMGLYYTIGIDGTGMFYFDKRHCPNCLKVVRDDKSYYYHNILEAKLILPNGFAFSIESEFIENEAADVSKQDCELKAFYRLAPRLKKAFPQMKICLLLDSLYAAGPVSNICEKYNWKFITVFKQGSMPALFQEFESLKVLTPQNHAENTIKGGSQEWHWVNHIDHENQRFNVLECIESRGQNLNSDTTRWVWLTNFFINNTNHLNIGKGGRLRWKIENEGWNMQKNGGYELEHAYSLHEIGMKNFYILLQIAHFLSQLMEKGSLLKPFIEHYFGSIRNIARRLLESLRFHSTSPVEMNLLLDMRFQIRFDSS
jgi:hypothetical protein